LLTGVGRAYLAFCPDQEREGILEMLRRSDQPEDRLARDPKRLDEILAVTRARGYGTRDPVFTGGNYGGSPFDDDGLAAIAIPLLDRTRVHGSINILWIKTAFTIEEFADRHLADPGSRGRDRGSDPAPARTATMIASVVRIKVSTWDAPLRASWRHAATASGKSSGRLRQWRVRLDTGPRSPRAPPGHRRRRRHGPSSKSCSLRPMVLVTCARQSTAAPRRAKA
jgi:hypothetical protein